MTVMYRGNFNFTQIFTDFNSPTNESVKSVSHITQNGIL